jgi:hypothetical protein
MLKIDSPEFIGSTCPDPGIILAGFYVKCFLWQVLFVHVNGHGLVRHETETRMELPPPLMYHPPAWSARPPHPYVLDVLKTGLVVESIPVHAKPFYLFGMRGIDLFFLISVTENKQPNRATRFSV